MTFKKGDRVRFIDTSDENSSMHGLLGTCTEDESLSPSGKPWVQVRFERRPAPPDHDKPFDTFPSVWYTHRVEKVNPFTEILQRSMEEFREKFVPTAGGHEDHGLPVPSTGEVRVVDPETGGEKGQKPERYSLIPAEALAEVARVYGYGATKYDDNNWRRGYKWSLSLDALQRHIEAFRGGVTFDEESGHMHLAHAAFHLFTLMTFDSNGLGTDDRGDVQ